MSKPDSFSSTATLPRALREGEDPVSIHLTVKLRPPDAVVDCTGAVQYRVAEADEAERMVAKAMAAEASEMRIVGDVKMDVGRI